MQELLKPIRSESLKDRCVERFEQLILSGKISIGQKLPSERELAMMLGVSRPVVHEGLVEMAAKGLVSMIPRVGTVVNDYRRQGSLSLLNSLVNFHNGQLAPVLLDSVLEMRTLFEVETARLAALRREAAHLEQLEKLLEEELSADVNDADRLAAIDFKFHHTLSMAAGNLVYPLMLNSFRELYLNLSGRFFSTPGVAREVFSFHKVLLQAIDVQNEQAAAAAMQAMLAHGARHLKETRTET
jgi:GntR family transcriptional regulator, transcriptional repressor for pyruvate dehydrogenase complex